MMTKTHTNGKDQSTGKKPLDGQALPAYPISIADMRRRYLMLYTGAVNDVLRFNYNMHTTSLPTMPVLAS